MFKHTSIALAISASFLVTGCLEVEDNNNDDIISAIENQNKPTVEVESAQTATLTGTVEHLISNDKVNNALVSIKIGNTWSEPKAATDGIFELSNLALESDFALLVSSADDSFQERAFYGNTGTGISQLGALEVTNQEIIEFEVLQNGTNAPVTDLDFTYSTSKGLEDISNWQQRNEHYVSSTFNEQTGTYSIARAVGLNRQLLVDLDIDNDAIDDYVLTRQPNQNNTIFTLDLDNNSSVYVSKTAQSAEFSVRLSVIDTLGNTINDLDIVAYTQLSKTSAADFDSTTNEYVFEYKGTSTLNLMLPSYYDSQGTLFQSSKITVKASDGGANIQGNYNSSVNGFHQIENGAISIVTQPQKGYQSPQIDVVSQDIDLTTQGFYVFLDTPVELIESEISLTKVNQLNVIRGNDSDTDFVEPGVTSISLEDVAMPLTASLSLSDNFITVLPTATLSSGNYRYEIDKVIEKSTNVEKNVSAGSSFTVDQAGEFNIDDIKFDNNNGFTNGELIFASNTAGISAENVYSSNNGAIYLPSSIESLESLKLALISYTRDGIQTNEYQQRTIVSEGNTNTQQLRTVATALNENVLGETYNIHLHTSLDDGSWYISDFDYQTRRLNDNTVSSNNQVTLGYEYKVKGSEEVITGKITLPVL